MVLMSKRLLLPQSHTIQWRLLMRWQFPLLHLWVPHETPCPSFWMRKASHQLPFILLRWLASHHTLLPMRQLAPHHTLVDCLHWLHPISERRKFRCIGISSALGFQVHWDFKKDQSQAAKVAEALHTIVRAQHWKHKTTNLWVQAQINRMLALSHLFSSCDSKYTWTEASDLAETTLGHGMTFIHL